MTNAFESGERKAIPAVLVYAECGDDILMLHRVTRENDFHKGKWNGLGGKCEPGESPLETAKRELLEESGLDLPESAFKPLGVLQFPDFKPQKGEDWLVFVFTAQVPVAGRASVRESVEGKLHWIQRGKLLELNLWDGDREFLPLVLTSKPFIGTFWYEDGRCVRHWLRPF